MSDKRTWETPMLEVFGSMPELTATKADPNPGGAPNAKLTGDHDGVPFQDCPPGLAKMGDGCAPPGQGGTS
jgi:hypothetical protein